MEKKLKIFLPEPEEIHPSALKLLKKRGFEITTDKASQPDVIFVKTIVNLDAKYLKRYKKVKYILRAGVGLDNIDLKYATRRGIKVFNAPASNSNAVAEYAVLVTLILLRNISNQIESLESGGWRDPNHMGQEIKGRTVGLIGCGAIGKLAAKKFSAFDPKEILGFDPFLNKSTLESFGIKKTGLTNLLKKSDIISLHLPLNEDTKNLIGQKELSSMKENVVLISAARGGIVNEEDLVKVLKSGKKIKVALDVYESEPEVKKEFLKIKQVITTPHIAAYTEEAQKEMSVVAVKNFLTHFNSI